MARWLTIHDDLLRGLTHALSNRVGTISAIAYMVEQTPTTAATSAPILRDESERLDELLRLLRVLPRRVEAVFEPVVPTDATTQALALHGHHPDLRDLLADVVLNGDLQPAYVDPDVLTMAIAVALGTAHRAVGVSGQVVLTISSTTESVQIAVQGAAPDHAKVDADDAASHDVDAVNWLLGAFGGHGIRASRGLIIEIPTLQSARRLRQA